MEPGFFGEIGCAMAGLDYLVLPESKKVLKRGRSLSQGYRSQTEKAPNDQSQNTSNKN